MKANLEIIEELEKKWRLEQLTNFYLIEGEYGYFLDDAGQVIGLGLRLGEILDMAIVPNLLGLVLKGSGLDDISGISCLDDISGIRGLKKLTWLDLSDNELTDISVLETLPQLVRLDLSDNELTDISILKELPNLNWLDLSRNQLDDISALCTLTNLMRLDLGGNQITDISALQALSNLIWLDLGGNQITDISALSGLPKLKEVDLGANQITDISALSGLSKLKEVQLYDNQITGVPIALCKKIPRISLCRNRIQVLSPQIAKLGVEIKWEPEFRGKKDGLFLKDNPLEIPPIEVVKQGRKAIHEYFKLPESASQTTELWVEDYSQIISPRKLIPTNKIDQEQDEFVVIEPSNLLPIIIAPIGIDNFIILDGNHRAYTLAKHNQDIRAIIITKDSQRDTILNMELQFLIPPFPHRDFLKGHITLHKLILEAKQAAKEVGETSIMDMVKHHMKLGKILSTASHWDIDCDFIEGGSRDDVIFMNRSDYDFHNVKIRIELDDDILFDEFSIWCSKERKEYYFYDIQTTENIHLDFTANEGIFSYTYEVTDEARA